MTRPPSQGRWTDTYGPRVNPITGNRETHHGLDINASAGLILVAPEPATLTHWGPVPGWEVHGNVAILEGASGWEHWLSHTDRLVPARTVGDTLNEDDPIAVMGETGQADGVHVHWETRLNGQRLDPAAWLADTATTTSRPFPTAPISLEDDMLTIHAPNRGIALIGPGYFKSLTPEEAENAAAICTKQISGNERQFDLWRQMAIGGDHQ